MEVSISISRKIFHLTRVAVATAAGFITEDDVLIWPSQTRVLSEAAD
jgi:hypothetical protein